MVRLLLGSLSLSALWCNCRAEPTALGELSVDEVGQVLRQWNLFGAFGDTFRHREYDGLTLTKFLSVEDLIGERASLNCQGSPSSASTGNTGGLCNAHLPHFRRLEYFLEQTAASGGTVDLVDNLLVNSASTDNFHYSDAPRDAERRRMGKSEEPLAGIRIRKNNSAVTFGETADVSLVRSDHGELTVGNDLVVLGSVKVGDCELDACELNDAVAELQDSVTDVASSGSDTYASAMARSRPTSCFQVWQRAYAQYGGAAFPPNGVYILQNTNGTARQAYCDIERGGWELALRVMSSLDSVFDFDSEYWENSVLLNAKDFDPTDSSTDAKYASFVAAPVGHMRGCFDGSTAFTQCVQHSLPEEYDSLTSLFSSVTKGVDNVDGGITFQDLTEDDHYRWLDVMEQDRDICDHDISWWAAGINLDDTASSYDAKVRFGFMENNEASITTANNAFGFGAMHANGDGVAAGVSCYSDTEIPEAATLWIQPAHDTIMFPASCYDVLQSVNPAATNGVYDLTNPSTNTSYRAYCDMNNGGWELALRTGSSSTFVYDSAYWENDDLLSADDFDPDADSDAKYASFVNTAVGYLRGCFGSRSAGSCNTHSLPTEYDSLTEMFSTVVDGEDGVTGGVTFSDLTEAEHYQWLVNMGLDEDVCGHTISWYAAGINLDDTRSTYEAKVRFGFMENNEDTIITANNAFGFGAEEANGFSLGSGATCYPGESASTAVKGSIWVMPAHAVPTQTLYARAQNGVRYG